MTSTVRDGSVYIYALCSSEDRKPRYVGQTVNVEQRRGQHCAPTAKPAIWAWVTSVRAGGHDVCSDVLCIVPPGADANDLERAFIAMFPNLLNAGRGDSIGTKVSIASRALANIAESLGNNSLARILGASGGLVSRWTRGISRPEAHWCIALREEFGIPVADWFSP